MLEALTDEELVSKLKRAVKWERRSSRTFLEVFIEFSRRGLQQKSPHATLFAYCTRELRLSEGDAYRRIRAMDAARQFPVILDYLESGELHISAVAVLSAHLNKENHAELLRRAKSLSKRELESLIAGLPTYSGPAPAKDRIVLLATPSSGPRFMSAAMASSAAPAAAPAPTPSFVTLRSVAAPPTASPASAMKGPESSEGSSRGAPPPEAVTGTPAPPPAAHAARVTFLADRELLEELTRAKELLKQRFPGSELGPLLKAALKALLEQCDPERGAPPRRRAVLAGRRLVPKWVRRAVRKRDGGRCAFRCSDGRRCQERSWLEYDHIVPFAQGGRSDDPRNIRLLCRAHNQQAARAIFGERPGVAAASG